ncbi:hypothetical protein LR1_08150 [Lacticaseibacillus rhamnosus DSM 20021 = JCM 1136 = NBRC 3425]|nr:hypothetical protein LR1_08150 [Lacticaseibacillus rhamnosus DSM 20021 = JCM 1136 = NBRC 3425]
MSQLYIETQHLNLTPLMYVLNVQKGPCCQTYKRFYAKQKTHRLMKVGGFKRFKLTFGCSY